MNTKKEQISDSKVKLTIELTEEELLPFVDRAYKEIAKTVKVQGFRPGKAPKSLIEKEVGSEIIEKYVLEEAIPGSYYDAVQKEQVLSIGSPEVKVLKFVPTDGLSYEATVDVMPEIKLPDLSKIKAKKEEIKVEKAEIDESLEYLRKMLAEKKEIDRPAKKDDRVEIDFEGSISGVPFEGGKSKNHPLVIGSNTFIPGFEDNLIGMKKGEEKEFKITFPKDYGEKNLAGKETTFKVKLNLLEETILPELDDEFAGKIGPFKKIDELRKDIEDKTRAEKEIKAERTLDDEILKNIAEATKMEAPEVLIHEELQRMTHEAEHNLGHSGLNLDKYLEMTKKTREDFEKELSGEAEKRVKIGLILSEIVEKEGFEMKEEELDAEIQRVLQGIMPEKRVEAEGYYNSDEGRRSLENNLMAKKAMDWIRKQVSLS